ncbi:MAG: hypothetical protein KKB70_04300 [Proteobacteria bacterium]|nr:hypothetical protein [Pseudomonadota bacterium]MBU1612366.1 hypothetical protein [Pseudomonadota bacterium]
MRFFSVKGNSPTERGFRAVAMVFVVMVVIWAFWKNNETVVRQIQQKQAFWDQTGQAPHQLKTFVRDFVDSLEEEYGVKARVQVLRGDPVEPKLGEDELYLGLFPEAEQVILRLEPAGEKERELITYVEQEYFKDQWDNWPSTLESSLVVLWNNYSGEGKGFKDVVATKADISDETGALTPEDLAFIGRFAAGLEKEFGQKAIIQVSTDNVRMPDLDTRTMFLGLSPATEEVLLSFPPLLRSSLGPELVAELQNDHFKSAFKDGNWPQALKAALVKIWKALAGEDIQ